MNFYVFLGKHGKKKNIFRFSQLRYACCDMERLNSANNMKNNSFMIIIQINIMRTFLFWLHKSAAVT